MKYSRMLKEILTESHWTQEQLATKLGVSFATVNSWINGRTKPQKSLMPDIERLYLAQDLTREPEPVYVTLVNVEDVRVGDYVILEKDYDNKYDDEAIMAYPIDGGMPVIIEDSEENKSKERWIILDALDSGYSIDNIIDFKDYILNLILEKSEQLNVETYIIITFC